MRPESVAETTGSGVPESDEAAPESDAVFMPAVGEAAAEASSSEEVEQAALGVAQETEAPAETKGSGVLRTLLMLLLVIVLGLVIGALVWFLVLNRSSTSALALVAQAVPLLG